MADAVRQFEDAFAAWLGATHAFAFWKGRVALYAILRGLGVGAGDEVILPGYTCVVAVNPIMYLGAKPIYVDIEPVTYNINPGLIEAKITPRTRVILAQHTYGYPAEMEAILDVANRHGLPVVEDSCLAPGSTYKGRKTGTFGLAAFWSFQWNKTCTTGIGGMATTNDADLAPKIEQLGREEALRPRFAEAAMLAAERVVHRATVYPKSIMVVQSIFRWLVDHKVVVGSSATAEYKQAADPEFFKTMSRGQARAGLHQLRRLEDNLAHRRHMTRLYDTLLDEQGWPRPRIPSHIDPVLVRYPVRVADKAAALALARKELVELGTWFECPLHQALVALEKYEYHAGMCPNAEKAAREVVNLPTHPRAKERHARESVEVIARIGPAA